MIDIPEVYLIIFGLAVFSTISLWLNLRLWWTGRSKDREADSRVRGASVTRGLIAEQFAPFTKAFEKLGWEKKPILSEKPRLIGDFRKNLVFVEVQFGNTATLYRDFYKFQYGLQNGLLSLSVLIVPMNPKEFFPTRPRSISDPGYLTILNSPGRDFGPAI